MATGVPGPLGTGGETIEGGTRWSRPSGRRADRLLAAALVIVVVALYARTIGYGLYLDDQHHARPWTWREVIGTFHGPFDPLGLEPVYFRPLVVVTFAFDWALWGYRSAGYHVTNIALHAVAVVLVFRVLRRTTVPRWAAFAGAALFAAIPANAATVVYISERSDAMVAIFVLAGCLAVARYADDRRWRWLVALVACFLLSVGSKEVGVGIVLATPVFLCYRRVGMGVGPAGPAAAASPWRHWMTEARRDLRLLVSPPERRMFASVLIPLGVGTVAYLGYRALVLPTGVAGTEYGGGGVVQGLAAGILATAKGVPWEMRAWSFPLLLVLAAAALVRAPRSPQWRVVVLGVVFAVATVAPLARLGQIEPRLLYLPEVGVAIAVAGLLAVLTDGVPMRLPRRPFAVATTLVAACFALVTVSVMVRSADLFRPGSPKKLQADYVLWLKPTRDRWPAHYLRVIEQRLKDAGYLDADGRPLKGDLSDAQR